MRKKPRPELIGAFVLGAMVLFVAAIVVLGSGRLFETTRQAVAYFEGSVAGLNEGAPVTFRGVRVGQVKNVTLRVSSDDLTARIPVYLELDLGRIDWVGEQGFTETQTERLIEKGLRAKLVPQSFVTGQLMVELDFQPDTPARLVGGTEVPEIPTAPSEFDVLKSSLSELPLRDMVGAATQAVTRLNEILSQDAADEVLPATVETLAAYRGLAEDLRQRIGPLADNLEASSQAATDAFEQTGRSMAGVEQETAQTLQAVRQAITKLEAELVPLARQLRDTGGAADSAFRQAERTLNSAEQTLDPGSATQRDLRRALEEFSRAARAVRALAEKLERNPNALITGNR